MKTLSDCLSGTSVSFGTSGLRGLSDELEGPIVCVAVRAFLAHMRDSCNYNCGGNIFVAHDLRPSSPAIAALAISTIEQLGYTVVFGGAIPTPALAFTSISENAPALMITGSHIPFDRNGVKFYSPSGEITKQDEISILNAAISDQEGQITAIDLPAADPTIAERYKSRYEDTFRNSLQGLRIGFYEHSAVGRDLTKELFSTLGAEIVSLGRTNKFVPIDTEAVSHDDRIQARKWIENNNLDALISTDGDGDRPLVFDGDANFVPGDLLGIFCARFLDAHTIVTPISSTSATESSNWFPNVIRTRIGSPHVLAGMADASKEGKESHIITGFEANGGFLLNSEIEQQGNRLNALPTRDAILPILTIFALAKRSKLSIAELRNLLPKRFTASDRLQNFARQKALQVVDGILQNPQLEMDKFQNLGRVASVNNTDGARVTFENQDIVHFRPSGNAPEFRIYVECETQDGADQKLAYMISKTAIMYP